MQDGIRPFWKDDSPADPGDDRGEVTPASSIEPAADDDAGEWVEVPHVAVTLQDASGNELPTAYFPYDPDNPPTEEAATAQAAQLYADLEHLRSILNQEVVLDLAQTIEESGTAAAIIREAADAARDALVFTVKATDGEAPDELEAARESVERLFLDNLEMIVSEVAAGGETPGTFWQDFARDVLAHALLWARDETADELGESAARLSDDEFDEATLAAYRNGPYITQAMLTLAQDRIELLGERFVMFLNYTNEAPDGRELINALIEKARTHERAHQAGGAGASATIAPGTASADGTTVRASAAGLTIGETSPAPLFAPPFTPDGYGSTTNDLVSISARRALSADGTRWHLDASKRPVFEHRNKRGSALISPSLDRFPTPEAALKEVAKYSDGHVALFKYITTKYMANRADHSTGPYDGFYISAEEFLDARGLTKHKKGGHKTENLKEVIELIDDLRNIDVRGHVEGHAKGKSRKRETVSIDAPLIIVSHTIRRKSLNGEETPIAWYLRPGDWAAQLREISEYHATTVRALLRLNAQNDQHALRLGFYLTEDYRIRSFQRTWSQPYTIEKMLEGAEILIDRSNPGRFRKRIEDALDVLKNPVTMHGTPVIASWRYAAPVPAPGKRGAFKAWLAAGIIITPPERLMPEIGAQKQRRNRPRKLASGAPK